MRQITLISTVIFVAICTLSCVKKPILTKEATNVRLLTKTEPVSGQCREIGNVSTRNDWFREVGDVNTYLRNEAANLGANIVVVDVIEKKQNLYKGSGRAFLCKE